VRALKRKIEALEAGGSSGAAGKPGGEVVSLDVARVQAKIAATQVRIQSLTAQAAALRGRLATYERQVIQSPQVERGLVILMRDHESAQKKYEEIRAKTMTAQISENLEQESRAERFSLLEAPIVADKPIKPNRKKVIALGFFLALASAGGLVMLLETLNQRVRGKDALAPLLRHRVLVSIPYIATQTELLQRKKWTQRIVISSSAVVAILIVLVHFLYMPLDIVVFKILARLE
jgi:polysaccharide biosynthesis transport protein